LSSWRSWTTRRRRRPGRRRASASAGTRSPADRSHKLTCRATAGLVGSVRPSSGRPPESCPLDPARPGPSGPSTLDRRLVRVRQQYVELDSCPQRASDPADHLVPRDEPAATPAPPSTRFAIGDPRGLELQLGHTPCRASRSARPRTAAAPRSRPRPQRVQQHADPIADVLGFSPPSRRVRNHRSGQSTIVVSRTHRTTAPAAPVRDRPLRPVRSRTPTTATEPR